MCIRDRGYTVSYEYDMSQDLPKELKYCIISIVKEALSNVTRHSDADRVKLLLREHPAFYQILIQDNGKCVHPGDGTGIGITNMRQRVEKFGGTIDIRTENGYRIFIHIPKEDITAGRWETVRDFFTAVSVSYTHLDVYKRQAMASDSDTIILRVCNWEEYIDTGDLDEAIELDSGEIKGENSIVKDFEDWYYQIYGKKVVVEYSTVGTNE